MTAWIIVTAVLAVIVLLLSCPVHLYASYQEEWRARIRYLFITYTLVPKKTKRKRKKKKKEPAPSEKKEEQEKSSGLRDIIKEKGIKGLLELLKQLANAAVGGAKILFRHLVIRKCNLTVTVGDEDAAETAMEYGYLCAAVYPASGAIISNTKCRDHNIRVVCDFHQKETTVWFQGHASVKLVFLAAAAVTAFFRFLKTEIKNRKNRRVE